MLKGIISRRPFVARVAAQGAVLLGGYGLSQAFSFLRNALIGHALSKGDFGIAATITMLLMLVDTLSELGAERLVVQAGDGGTERFIATTHAVMAARGLLTGLIIALAGSSIAGFFQVPEAAWTFAAAGLVPMLRGFMHLDARRAQARLDNRATMIVEVLPQAVALAATPLVLAFDTTFAAVLWLTLLQALVALAATHALARTAYRLAADADVVQRLLRFGWPIWLSGIPLVAVYQGDRILIGRMYGMETLAAYSAAFMVAMVPGLIAGKIGNALMLPILSGAQGEPRDLKHRFTLLAEATALAASAYLAVFVTLGGSILVLAFGHKYSGLGGLLSLLAAMWAARMVQAVPGMALMAAGQTHPLLVAGIIRALALPAALIVAWSGAGVERVAAMGTFGELASLVYVALRVDALQPGLAAILLLRSALIVPFGFLALALAALLPASAGLTGAIIMTALALALIAAGGLATLPALRTMTASLRPVPRGA